MAYLGQYVRGVVCETCGGQHQSGYQTRHGIFGAELVPTVGGQAKWLCSHCKGEAQHKVKEAVSDGAHCWCRECYSDRGDGVDYASGLYKLGSGLCFDCFNARVDRVTSYVEHGGGLFSQLILLARGKSGGADPRFMEFEWGGTPTDEECGMAMNVLAYGVRYTRKDWEAAAEQDPARSFWRGMGVWPHASHEGSEDG